MAAQRSPLVAVRRVRRVLDLVATVLLAMLGLAMALEVPSLWL